jgi:LacI family transcriptional regulator
MLPEVTTIYDVARRSKVSTATVSRVVRGGTGYSAATRDRVLAVIDELGWVPSGAARQLASRRAGIIGLLFPDLLTSDSSEEDSPLFVDQVIRGAERAATSAGDAVLIAATRQASGRQLAFSVASKADGLVVVARSLSQADLASIADRVPIVVLAGRVGRRKFDYVAADNRGGARTLTSHLLEVHGYRDFAFIAGLGGSPDSDERFAGYREALTGAGVAAPEKPDAEGDFTETGGRRAMETLLASRPRLPQVVVVANDQMAIGALAVLRAGRLRVPGDVAMTGFDDIALARHVRPALTTVRQPMREMGEVSVRLLLERLANSEAPRQSVVLPTSVVLRRSCGCQDPPSVVQDVA